MEEVTRQQEEVRSEKTCTPCITVKNSYSAIVANQVSKIYVQPTKILDNLTSFTDAEKKNHSLWPSPQVLVYVSCLDRKYILLEEKPQHSLSQSISQIGGDLGLYIGFGMISFLEAALFVYHMYHHRKQSSNEDGDRSTRRSFTDGCRYVIKFIFRNINTARYNDMDLLTRNDTVSPSADSVLAELKAIRNEMREEMRKASLYQSEINSEVKKAIEELYNRIEAIREDKGRKWAWSTTHT